VNTIFTAFGTDESQIKTLRNMDTMLMFLIMGLVCRLISPEVGFRNLEFDLLYKCVKYIYSQGLQLPEPHITDRLGTSPKLIHLTSCL